MLQLRRGRVGSRRRCSRTTTSGSTTARGTERRRIGPELGPYSSDDAAVMDQQVRWAKQAGIGGFLVSWKHTPTLDRRLRQLVDIASRRHFALGVVYQGLDFHRGPLPADRVATDLGYFADELRSSRARSSCSRSHSSCGPVPGDSRPTTSPGSRRGCATASRSSPRSARSRDMHASPTRSTATLTTGRQSTHPLSRGTSRS